jgi:hypothetical protein
MLMMLRGDDRNRLPERKSRLFGAACCRRLWSLLVDLRSQRAVEVVERYADAAATADELDAAYEEAFDVETKYAEHPDRSSDVGLEAFGRAANAAAGACHPDELAEGVAREALTAADAAVIKGENVAFAELVRDIFGNPFRPVVVDTAWLTANVVALARGIYDDRAFDRMPILADALQDAGCDSDEILNHCRQPGEHVRGCWVVDAVLNKE